MKSRWLLLPRRPPFRQLRNCASARIRIALPPAKGTPMGLIKPPQPVKLIVGMLARSVEQFSTAEQALQTCWGEIDCRSDDIPFNQTRYYEKEMGPGLWRRFVSFSRLIDPGELADIKHRTNTFEAEQTQRTTASSPPSRAINLDPGYLEPSKLVLATTKNYSHRVYIGRGIWAEATLFYRKGRWQPWPYTYPDYAGELYHPFFHAVRRRLLEQLSSLKTSTS